MSDGEQSWVERLPWYTVPAILVGVPLLAWVLGQVFEAFWANIIWQYYWGPIVADAAGQSLCSSGAPPGFSGCAPGETIARGGYNVVNTLTWAGLLGLCLVGIWQMLKHFGAPMDNKLILGATAWVVTGSVWHVLQDSKLFLPPLEYIFITPPIYLLFGAFGVASFAYGQYVKTVSERTQSLERGLQKIWFLFSAIVLLYTLLWVREWSQIVIYVNPVWVALFAVATFAVIRYRAIKTQRIDASELTLTFSIGWFLLAMAYVWSFIQQPWPGTIPSDDLQYAAILAPALAGGLTAIVYAVARWFKSRDNKIAWAYLMPMNLVLVFSQMLDGFATAIGIDFGTYGEKHLLSEAVRRTTEGFGGVFAQYPTFLGFAPLKLLVSLLVIYYIDVKGKEDEETSETMVGLIKFAIIMVGIGPGVRNMVRMSLGI